MPSTQTYNVARGLVRAKSGGGGVGLVGGRVDDEHGWRIVWDAVNLTVSR